MYRAPRGTTDILPQEQPYWEYVKEKSASISALYGYQRIDTPVFEDARLFVRSVGEETDIVQKEMYTFEDRSGDPLTLRPEGTAPVCRAYIEHGMHTLPQPVKLYYVAAIFRYERPQAGRYRQHHQFGAEALGEGDPALDAEIIDMALRFYSELGLTGLTLNLNSIGCPGCRPDYLDALQRYYSEHKEKLCPDCRRRIEKNPLRLLDCKDPSCIALAQDAPKSVEHLCPECRQHFEKVQKYLHLLAQPFSLNYRLVRGLDYYTRTVFEIMPEGEATAQTAIGAGGRYDNLIAELGGKPVPGIGFGTGIERLVLNLKKQQVSVPPLKTPAVSVIYLGQEPKYEAVKLTALLRNRGVRAVSAFGERSLKALLKQADAAGTRYAVIFGEDEIRNGTATLRHMETGDQSTLPVEEVIGRLS